MENIMNNKIYEEALASALRRIEVLEDKMSKISIPNKEGYHEPAKQNLSGTSTPGQLGYIKKLGGKADPSMSKQEASNEIDKMLRLKDGSFDEDGPSVVEPKEVDTDDAGLDSEDLM